MAQMPVHRINSLGQPFLVRCVEVGLWCAVMASGNWEKGGEKSS